MLAIISGPAGEVTTQQFDVDLKPVKVACCRCAFCIRSPFRATARQARPARLVINRAPRRRQRRRPARRRGALRPHFQFDSGGDRRSRRGGSVLRPNSAFARLAQAASKEVAKGRLSIFNIVAERDRSPCARRSRRRPRARARSRPSTSRWKERGRRARPGSSSRPPIRAPTKARARPSSRSTPPSSARCKRTSRKARRCRPSASSPAASRTTSTTC